jgi:hypothetical protein
MATNAGRFNNISVEAASAVNQFEFVKMTSTGAAQAGDGELAIGVALTSVDPSATPATTNLSVQIDGIAMVKAGEAVAKGALVGSDANGFGVALDAASGANEIIRVLLKPVANQSA